MADLKAWLDSRSKKRKQSYRSEDDEEAIACEKGAVVRDDDLKRALKVSRLEAQVAEMDEEARIQEALRRSEVDEKGDAAGRRGESSSTKSSKAPAASLSRESLHAIDPSQSESLLLDWPLSCFSNKKGETIYKLNGSLDLLFVKRWIESDARQQLRRWLLCHLAWHRVSYTRPSTRQRIITPRFTATFGKDETGADMSRYPVRPKEIPEVLQTLMKRVEEMSNARYNALIINYYADGADSISYHSDDESFLGPLPTIASLSLGSSRDFFLRRKAPADVDIPPASTKSFNMGTKGRGPAASRPTEKMILTDGDLVVMRGKTQNEWEHSIPKRANAGGRINITFRRVMTVAGTNNFQRYNRGLSSDDDTNTYRWDQQKQRMLPGLGGL